MFSLLGLVLVVAAGWFALAPVTSGATGAAAARFRLPRTCVPLRDMLSSDHRARAIVCGDAVGTHLAWATVLLFAALVLFATGLVVRCMSANRSADGERAGQPAQGSEAPQPHL
jgi:hypothetical protein